MFTGLVEELGRVRAREDLGDSVRLVVAGPLVTTDTKPGDSVAVNGVCLTAVEVTGGAFSADVMKETLDRSSLGALAEGHPVNLERAAALGDRMGGHLVQGHVDGTGTVLERIPGERWELVRISLPASLARYLVEKGSITVDGISLTVVEAANASFTVSLIPETHTRTTLGSSPVGAVVNLEVDVVAKYVERMLAAQGRPTAQERLA